MLTRRAAIGAAASAAVLRGRPERRPNFLFLIADDHAGYVLGADGNRRAETPNLDRLASEGVRFSRHYCNSPICTPSRQSLLTGRLPHSAGVTLLASKLSEETRTLAHSFSDAGYRTAVFGKMHFNRPSRPGLFGFETCMAEDAIQREWGRVPPMRPVPPGMEVKPAWKPFQDPARIWLNAAKLPYGRYDEEMRGTFVARRAAEYLEARARDHEPFALWTSFMEPHSPYDFPIEDAGRFDPASFPPPPLGPEDAAQVPEVFAGLTAAEKSGIITAYYTSVNFLDRNVGRVLKKLADLGLDRDTFVVYTADHGYCLGQHGRFEKHIGYDPALRVPLILRWPGRIRPGVAAGYTEHVDLSATIVDLMGVEAPGALHGRSLRPAIEGRRASGRDHVFSEYFETEQAYLRTNRYKFIYATGRRLDWYKPAHPPVGRWRRLYDLRSDPGEFRDLSEREPALVRRFETLLLARFRSTHPEAQSEAARLLTEEALDFYLRPRDSAAGVQ